MFGSLSWITLGDRLRTNVPLVPEQLPSDEVLLVLDRAHIDLDAGELPLCLIQNGLRGGSTVRGQDDGDGYVPGTWLLLNAKPDQETCTTNLQPVFLQLRLPKLISELGHFVKVHRRL